MAAELIDWLLRSSLALAFAVALLLVLRPLFRRWLGAGAVLWLYLLLPAALLASSLPGPVQVVEVDATAMRAVAPSGPVAAPVAAFDGSLPIVLAWAAAALALAARLVVQQRRFRRRLGRLRLHSSGAWLAERGDTGPVLIGLLRPRIVVPADFEQRYLPAQQALVLAHERVHLQRGDLPANALACALRCVFWFHPLVHLAAAKLRLDQELACDAAVLRTHPGAGRDYATALLNTQLADLGLPVGCAWQSSHSLAWRITMLSKPPQATSRLALGVALALLASTATAATIWQQQPATLVTLPAVATTLAPVPVPALIVEAALPAPQPDTGSLAPVALPSPAPRTAESPERRSLPPPPMPREAAPAPPAPVAQVESAPVAAPDYQPPRVVRARPAKIPLLERDPQVVQVLDGVVVRVDIDASGKPVEVAVFESALGPIYQRNAIAAVKRWRFEPARRGGVAEPATVLVPVSFVEGGVPAGSLPGEALSHPKPTGVPEYQPVVQL